MVKFQPLSKEQASRVVPKGEYVFSVESAILKKSKKGSDMFEVNLRVYGDGKEILVRDHLLCDGVMAHRLRHFCEAIGKIEDYEAGELYPESFEGNSGRCKLAIEESNEYPDKNIVKDYISEAAEKRKADAKDANMGVSRSQQQAANATKRQEVAAGNLPESDIPFSLLWALLALAIGGVA